MISLNNPYFEGDRCDHVRVARSKPRRYLAMSQGEKGQLSAYTAGHSAPGPLMPPREGSHLWVLEETDRYWSAIVGNGGRESQCGWCKDRWGLSWQITPRALTDAMAAGGAEAKRAFSAMMTMGKIDVAAIEAARGG